MKLLLATLALAVLAAAAAGWAASPASAQHGPPVCCVAAQR